MNKLIITLLVASISWTTYASDNMTLFLKSCAYGTLGGAAVGLATLATSENPNGKMSNVARGASLGLYLGVAYGLYLVNNPQKMNSDFEAKVWITPQYTETKISGASINWLALRF